MNINLFNLSSAFFIFCICLLFFFYYHNNSEYFDVLEESIDFNNSAYSADSVDSIDSNNSNKSTEIAVNIDKSITLYDDETKSLMSGSEFIIDHGPIWIAPAWDPNANKPDIDQMIHDERFIYNKCSLSCCSKQFIIDPSTIGINPNEYNVPFIPSDYICSSNNGESGCLCVTDKQMK
jgi:hypothetical protein